MRSYLYIITAFILVSILTSCGTKRNLVYFSDLTDSAAYKEKILNLSETKIQSGDILNISVNTLSPESNILFNNGAANIANPADLSKNLTTATSQNQGYEVDKAGFINFPVVGKIQVSGLSKEAAADKLTESIKGYVKNPIVNISFVNFRITVIGEVNRPSTYILQNDQVNILEALGLAGDMTMYGKRENVLLIRKSGDSRTMVRLNLNNKSILNSPYFYLQQNDVIYVEPDGIRAVQASTNARNISLIIAAATILTVILSRVL
ncbi:polysaccharide biosynthesis/export family protein [Mucilaginibacter polytrichastri]|uniref:Soluble ligand binding domain-containing protein n=1 Tax=Mucilaginibacter polytrichastri TaxID=1302689 RepID=A0A1Q6A3B5_9SPHI|nr:polysaccharide biosynthesis/export family protein [Mucilaginibacter polytrichastri]OKS88472.1 hypothetical protein RG47T_3939 [Mucilaginibacter polytrichastri]SFT12270.1 polysaccharide export outer membrane protein [Mucilaginibacter polytrichastri]